MVTFRLSRVLATSAALLGTACSMPVGPSDVIGIKAEVRRDLSTRTTSCWDSSTKPTRFAFATHLPSGCGSSPWSCTPTRRVCSGSALLPHRSSATGGLESLAPSSFSASRTSAGSRGLGGSCCLGTPPKSGCERSFVPLGRSFSSVDTCQCSSKVSGWRASSADTSRTTPSPPTCARSARSELRLSATGTGRFAAAANTMERPGTGRVVSPLAGFLTPA